MGAEQSQNSQGRRSTTEVANFDFRGDCRDWVEEEAEKAKDCYSWQEQQEARGWNQEARGWSQEAKGWSQEDRGWQDKDKSLDASKLRS